MIEGAIIVVVGMAIGYYLALLITKEPKKNPYDKYKNKDGLYDRKIVKLGDK